MNIIVNNICGKYNEVEIDNMNATIKSGTMDFSETVCTIDTFLEAAYELADNLQVDSISNDKKYDVQYYISKANKLLQTIKEQ